MGRSINRPAPAVGLTELKPSIIRCSAIAAAVVGALAIGVPATSIEASAQRALYGRQPGRDAVFVRFVNALDTDLSINTDALPVQKLGTGGGDRIGPYTLLERVDPNGLAITARAGTVEIRDTVQLKPGSKVSVLVRSNGGVPQVVNLSERSELNQTRTVLAFYNAAPECGAASLVLEPANVAVFPDVPVDAERSRGINPIRAQFSTTCGERGVATATLDRAEAGGAYSAWLVVLGGRPTLIMGTDTLPSWKP